MEGVESKIIGKFSELVSKSFVSTSVSIQIPSTRRGLIFVFLVEDLACRMRSLRRLNCGLYGLLCTRFIQNFISLCLLVTNISKLSKKSSGIPQTQAVVTRLIRLIVETGTLTGMLFPFEVLPSH